jgi:signal peptidase I
MMSANLLTESRLKSALSKNSKFKLSRKKIETIAFIVIVALIVVLPFIAGTSSYPLTVVEGISMYPTLQNGDLVYYSSAGTGSIANGTIIVFNQDNSGNALLTSITQPVVIHRIIDESIHADGYIYYTTKGDNNQVRDASPVRADHVLGVERVVVPKIGYAFLFIKSPQGLIAIIGFVVIFYMSVYETKVWKDKKKAAFMGQLAQRTLNKELPEDLYRKFELATGNIENIDASKLDDGDARAMATWLKNSLDNSWTINTVQCEKCGNKTVVFESQKQVMLICIDSAGKCSDTIITYSKQKDQPIVSCGHCCGEAARALSGAPATLPQKQDPKDTA